MSFDTSLARYAAVVDCETTGLDAEADEIIELGIVLFSYDPSTHEPREVVERFVGQREPRCSISRDATARHGLTKPKLRGRTIDHERASGVLSRADFVVAHNARFDKAFLVPMFPAVQGMKWYCTLDGLPWAKWGFEKRDLQSLVVAHNLVSAAAHRADSDASNVFDLLGKKSPADRTYLAELIEFERDTASEFEPIILMMRKAGFEVGPGFAMKLQAIRPTESVERLALFCAATNVSMELEGSEIRGPGFFLWAAQNRWDQTMSDEDLLSVTREVVEHAMRAASPTKAAVNPGAVQPPRKRNAWQIAGRAVGWLMMAVVTIVAAILKSAVSDGKGRRRRR